mgnify:CR=1 FL=1
MSVRGAARVLLILIGLLGWAVPGRATHAVELDLQALDALEPTARHRQLSLMLLVSAGVDEAMLDAVTAAEGAPGETGRSAAPAPRVGANGEVAPSFDADRYTSPLARIVDQASLLAGAAQLFRFTLDNEAAIRDRLDALERTLEGGAAAAADDPAGAPAFTVGPAALAGITADTILIRTAIGDAMASVPGDNAGALHAQALRYRERTVVLRNALEYAEFKAALDALTDQAIASVGGRLDAYQRMFDEETNTAVLDRRIRSAELIYLPEGQFDPRAGELTEEMLNNMVLMESQPHR